MGKVKYCIIFLIVFLFIGCPTRSLFPLFLEKDLVFSPLLIGTWIDVSKEEHTMTIRQSDQNCYNIISYNLRKGDTTLFEAQLGSIGKSWFVDSYIARKMRNEYVIPVHSFSKIWLNKDTLYYATLNGDQLNKMIAKGELTIPHINYGGDILLTASTEQLQQLVMLLADDERVFDKTEILIRLK
jgi:hypothetical protein